MAHHTGDIPAGKPGPTLARIRISYQHDLDRGVTVYDVFDYRRGEWFSRELPTPEFLDLLRRIGASCRVTEVHS